MTIQDIIARRQAPTPVYPAPVNNLPEPVPCNLPFDIVERLRATYPDIVMGKQARFIEREDNGRGIELEWWSYPAPFTYAN